MKAKELMIGDWVIYRGEPTIVYEIDEYYKRINTEPDGYDSIKCIDTSEIEPIPITPEILEKNGWKVKKSFVQHGNFGDGPLMLWHTEGNKILRNFTHELEISDLSTDKGFRVRIECNYVHELQHALRLCGIEKEIVL